MLRPRNILIPVGQVLDTTVLGEVRFADPQNRHVGFVFLQDEWKFAPDWTLTTGVRADYYSDFGLTVNPRLSIVWHIDSTLTGKIHYGRAFRAPSFLELYANEGLVARGNTNLDPETINTVELSLIKRWPKQIETQSTLFWYETNDLIFEDQIRTTPTSPTLRTFNNTKGSVGYGLELTAIYPISDVVNLNFNYTFLETRSLSAANQQITAVNPQHKIYAQFDWEFMTDWHFDLRSTWVIDRDRANRDRRVDIGDYVLLGTTLRRENLFDRLGLSFTVNNLLDQKAKEPSIDELSIPNDYPLAGIEFLGTVDLRF